MLLYATETDLIAWVAPDDHPANARRLLRSASLLVRRATMTAVYATASGGLPSDPDLVTAFRDATCAQAAAWVAQGIDPAGGAAGTSGVPTSSSIGGGSVSYAVPPAALDARATAASQLCDEALAILTDAGLAGTTVGVW